MIADEIRALAEEWPLTGKTDRLRALADRVEAVERDAARLDWCMSNISGRAWRQVGVYYASGCDRAAIDAAIKEQADATNR